MGFAQALRAVGGAVLAGALVLGVSPAAQANDGARAAQWPLKAYELSTKVWPHSKGKGVIVAVIDSGVRASHLDLHGQVLSGVDYVHGGNGQKDYSPEGHGTGLASLIAGHGHGAGEQDGIMGVAPDAKILPIGVGEPTQTWAVDKGIRYAVDHGAKVINLSLGQAGTGDPVEEDAIAYAEQHDVVVVAAAGNAGIDEDEYPASYPGVVSVGGVDENAQLWSGSSYGKHLVLMGPATNIVRDSNGSDTQMYKGDGTSYATAFVSGIAALVRSAHPDFTQGQTINYMIKMANPGPGQKGWNDHYGYGIATATVAKNIDPGPKAGPLPQSKRLYSDSSASPSSGSAGGAGNGSGSNSGEARQVPGAAAAARRSSRSPEAWRSSSSRSSCW
ncbi:S8 family serine peptidase [Streptacidiphilus monticola]